MNKKLFKMPILFALILCMCFVFVGCGEQDELDKDTPPEGVSQDFYDDVLSVLNKTQKVYQSDELKTKRKGDVIYPLYDNGFHILSKKYRDSNDEYISSLSEKEEEILITMNMIDFYAINHFDNGILNKNNSNGEEKTSFIFDESIREQIQHLSELLEIELKVDIQENKIIIEKVKQKKNELRI